MIEENKKADVLQSRELRNRVKDKLREFDFILNFASGLDSNGVYYLPVIKIGMESRVIELPLEIEGIRIEPRFEKDE